MRKVYRWGIVGGATLALCVAAVAQEEGDSSEYESTTITTYESGERDISSPVNLMDATPQATGTIDFRLRMDYVTESSRQALGTDDDFGVGTKIVWGPCENAEMWVDLPFNLGDGRDAGDANDGNGDISVGFLYRFWDEDETIPAFAFATTVRTPTGNGSQDMDAEFRAILTKTLCCNLRAHANAFLTTVNGNNASQGSNNRYWGSSSDGGFWGNGRDNFDDARHLQWGVVLGIDAALTEAEDLWLILDYMHRSSEHYGNANMNIIEAGLEWQFAEGQGLHFSTQMGLDDNGDTPNFGARVSYTYEIGLN